jgi:hypothetical protein
VKFQFIGMITMVMVEVKKYLVSNRAAKALFKLSKIKTKF